MDLVAAANPCDTLKNGILKNDEKGTFGRYGRASCIERCQLSYFFVIVSFVIIGTAVLWNWQQTVMLEQQMTAVKEQQDEIANRLSSQRIRRLADRGDHRDLHDDSYHEIHYHHGIHSSSIAHYDGDPERLLNTPAQNGRLWFQEVKTNSSLCTKMRRNGYNQQWCSHEEGQSRPTNTFATSEQLQMYPYFKPSHWMDHNISSQYYQQEANGWVRVKTNGTYLAYAHVSFLNSQPNAKYTMEVERGGAMRFDISACAISSLYTESLDIHRTSPCTSLIITFLNAGDRLALRIQPGTRFRVSKENLYFGLIKLNEKTL